MSELKELLKPLIRLFSEETLKGVLLAWLPTKLEKYYIGIIAVDMFITTLAATFIITLLHSSGFILNFLQSEEKLTIQIEYYVKG
ncbi:13697_t:CDS:1, partial [Dentiscutata heterogama]